MSGALINQEILAWAIDRAGITLETIAKKAAVKTERLESWLHGDEKPTFRQAQTLSSILHIPFGYFFLKEPPEEALSIPDLRTINGDPALRLDTNFRALLSDVFFKHAWYRDLMIQHGVSEQKYVGKFTLADSSELIASDIRLQLFGGSDLPSVTNWEKYLQSLIGLAEEAGIWVMRSSIVGNNTSRPLSVEQFRGFAISDPIVPLIFINGRDAKAAQIFTLAHELAHIWLGESGISNPALGQKDFGSHKKLEKKCNEIAAEFLVPKSDLISNWRENDTLEINIDRLSKRYLVSRIVVARRAYDLGLLNEEAFKSFYAMERIRWEELKQDSTGGSFHNTLPIRFGRKFTDAVINQTMSGSLLLKHAGTLLNTRPDALVNFSRKQAS